MYFVIIMAFALVLSDSLPPQALNLFAGRSSWSGPAYQATIAIAFGQLLLIAGYAWWMRRRTLSRIDGTPEGHDAAADTYGRFQHGLLFVLSALLVLTLVCTPWTAIGRTIWGLGRFPLIADLVILAPLFLSLLIVWVVNYAVELRLRTEALAAAHVEHGDPPEGPLAAVDAAEALAIDNAAVEALKASKKRSSIERLGLREYLIDKFRHQVLILAAPMCIIVAAKFFLNKYGPQLLPLPKDRLIQDIILNAGLGVVSVIVLVLAPWMLRHIWATEPLPAGALRDRFTATCDRIGLRYREILLWHTHGATVNAAVMGFVAPLRYVLVSDALLETMDEEEIEAVFGHEAGHVRHWHLPFFGAFALVSMYVAGGVMHLLLFIDRQMGAGYSIDNSLLQMSALATLLLMWLFGFAWLSRKFERQADLFGVRCITPDVPECLAACPVHGTPRKAGLCVTAAGIFERTLTRIAELNGIPKESPSWRHGSIESRCQLIERFVKDIASLRRFDRKILAIKMGLLAALVVGSVVAVWIYYEPVKNALRDRPLRAVRPASLRAQ
ncbi:MAG TPA: M48 family metallopeptidase [Phycisphaerae bacterium]|nr:M48 family metallopeptidase [Phycisphaerae bacterium]